MVDTGREPAVRSWQRGWLPPLAGAVVVAAVFFRFAHWQIGQLAQAAQLLGPAVVIVFVLVFALLILIAVRRKATLTPETLILRRTFGTDRVQLREIVKVTSVKASRTSVTKSCVAIRLADGRWVRSLAFGLNPAPAIAAVTSAVQAAGGHLHSGSSH